MNAVPPIARSTLWDRLPSWAPPAIAVTLVVLLTILILLFSYSAACLDRVFHGPIWFDLGALVQLVIVVPLCGIVCATLALALVRRGTHRLLGVTALVIVLPLACPPVNIFVAESVSSEAALWWKPWKDAHETDVRLEESQARERVQAENMESARNAAIDRHYETLSKRFKEPLRIAKVVQGLIVVDDGTVIQLFGIARSKEMVAALESARSDILLGRHVEARLPERPWFESGYQPMRPGREPMGPDAPILGHSPVDPLGWRYGIVSCLLYVDGRLLNSRFAGMPGSYSHFQGYESPSHRPD